MGTRFKKDSQASFLPKVSRHIREKRERERIKTLAMLLGADWRYDSYFYRENREVHGDFPTNWPEYFDKDGKQISHTEAQVLSNERLASQGSFYRESRMEDNAADAMKYARQHISSPHKTLHSK